MNNQSKLSKALVVATALSMPALAYASQPADFAKVATVAVHAKRTIDLDNAVAFDMSDIINIGRAVWTVITNGGTSGTGSGSGTTCTTTCTNDGSGGSTCTTTCGPG
jgi:hypothetical protein